MPGWVQRISSKISQLKNLTLVDSRVTGLANLLDAVGLNSLEQLIIIYNDDCEETCLDSSMPEIYAELMEAALPKYPKLRYFEFSLYNDTAEPSLT